MSLSRGSSIADVLQVVLAGAADDEGVGHGSQASGPRNVANACSDRGPRGRRYLHLLLPHGQARTAVSWLRAHAVDLALVVLVLACAAPIVQPLGHQQMSRMALTAAVWDDGALRIDGYPIGVDRAEHDGHVYSDKAPGQPFFAIPAYAAYRATAGRARPRAPPRREPRPVDGEPVELHPADRVPAPPHPAGGRRGRTGLRPRGRRLGLRPDAPAAVLDRAVRTRPLGLPGLRRVVRRPARPAQRPRPAGQRRPCSAWPS